MSQTIHCDALAQQNAPLAVRPRAHSWPGWAPAVLLPLLTLGLRARLLPWVFMWLLAASIFAACKWRTWWGWRMTEPCAKNWQRSMGYLFLWPGMDPQEFFTDGPEKRSVPINGWLSATAKLLAGTTLIWAGAQAVSLQRLFLGGWMGMLGLVLALHFGAFDLAALAWRHAGIPVTPLMQRPLASRSLSELWGRRWNLGFRALSHTWVFEPLRKRFHPATATLGAFLASGLLHDLVISLPARAGFGLPTAYFLAQGLGVIFERSASGQRLGLRHGIRGWLWTALVAAGPLYWLFHPWFVMRVIVPFLRAIAR